MNRIIPTAIGGFAVFMLMLRAFETQRGAATTTASEFDVVDGVLQSLTQAGGFAFPPAMLLAGVAMILAVGYAVVS